MYELLADLNTVFQQPEGFRLGAGLMPLVMAALGTLVLNAITGTSDAVRMIGNFGLLLAGAMIAMAFAGLFRPPGDVMVIAIFASTAGMTIASISSMAILKTA